MIPTRIRIDDAGRLEVVDPSFAAVRLLRAIDPGFKVVQAPLPGFTAPRLLRTRRLATGKSHRQLAEASEDALWELHGELLTRQPEDDGCAPAGEKEASLLDLKVELARRQLFACRLCGQQCRVNRWQGALGECGLGTGAKVVSHFVHIAEEPLINPSLNLQLAGCGLRCRFCQQGELLNPAAVNAPWLSSTTWAQLRLQGARSFTLIGGNPDESLYAVLRFLKTAPAAWRLPLVWNCHGYSSPVTLSLLDGLVDVYVPDYKFGRNQCGQKLSGAKNYPAIAQEAIKAMLAQGVPVIVRLLVLPGHFDCCHRPGLVFLAAIKDQGQLWVSVRGQYCPDWLIGPEDGELARRVTPAEVRAVIQAGRTLGLRLITD
ncbi:MAG: hypothetical protein BZ151_09535 [Desulfobacca sp. 4484_104]|nr:MAG: hypothetical protein BZ151_09535 [Desulfobacca sp. 4484_104]